MTSMFSRRMSLLAAGAVVAASLFPAATHAVPVHRYTFSGNANDSIGTAHATVVDGGTTANFAYLNGYLALTPNSGQGSDAATLEDAFVDLPNGIISAAAASGTSGAVSFEWWFTVGVQRTWQRIGDFGTANGLTTDLNDGENDSNGGGATDYIMVTPNSGRFGNGLEMTNHVIIGGNEPNAGLQGPFRVGAERHVVAVYDKNDLTAGPGGTMRLYLQGVQVDQDLIRPELDLNNFINNNNWLGRAQYNDPIFDGLFNEFVIYNHAVGAAEVSTNFTAGPIGGQSGPVFTVNRDTGSVVLSNVGSSVQVVGYSLTSAVGAFQPNNFAPIAGRLDATGPGPVFFDPDDAWTLGLNNDADTLQESMVGGGANDGGQLSTNTVTLNTAGNRLWTKYFTEDVRMMLQVQVGAQIIDLPANVVYTGNGGVGWRRSDLNFNGAIEPTDWVIFRDNHLKPIDPALRDPDSYPLGDLDGDQDNDFQDFRFFAADYDAANGEAAFTAMLAAVPEPSSMALIVMGAAGLIRRRRNS